MRRQALAIIAEPIAAIAVCAALIAGASAWPVLPHQSAAVKSAGVSAHERTEFAPERPNSLRPEVVPASLQHPDRADIKAAVSTFVWALSNGQKEAVWSFASDEDQAGFKTVDDTFRAMAGAFPPLAYASDIAFERVDVNEEVSTAVFYVKDKLGMQWRAAIDLVQDMEGQWKVIACDVQPSPGVSI